MLLIQKLTGQPNLLVHQLVLAKYPRRLVILLYYIHGDPFDDGHAMRALYESLILCKFLQDAFPSSTKMLPSNPTDRAYARIWIDHISKSFVPSFFRLVQLGQEPERQASAREELYTALRTFAGKIKGPYFLGDEFSMVDAAIAPWILRGHVVGEFRGYKREEVSKEREEYAGVVEKRESTAKTTRASGKSSIGMRVRELIVGQAKEHYTEIYGRYLRNESQSEVAKAVRSGRGLP